MIAYTTAKAAISGLTRSLARELALHNIRVNSVAPGAILTEWQIKLWLTPELEREFINGQCLKFCVAEVTSRVRPCSWLPTKHAQSPDTI